MLSRTSLERLQNPADCDATGVAICDLNKNCGFGCQMHHLTYCLVAAAAMGRPLSVNASGWRYNQEHGLQGVFQPLSRDW